MGIFVSFLALAGFFLFRTPLQAQAAGGHQRADLWQRRLPHGRFALGYEAVHRLPVSQADQAAEKMLLEQKLKQMEQEPAPKT